MEEFLGIMDYSVNSCGISYYRKNTIHAEPFRNGVSLIAQKTIEQVGLSLGDHYMMMMQNYIRNLTKILKSEAT